MKIGIRQDRAASLVNSDALSRRQFCTQVGGSLYGAALAWLLARESADSAPRLPLAAPKARSVIHLFMNGGPSQMDLFDPKPELNRRHGEDYFPRIAGEVEFVDAAGALLGSPFQFAQHGECGTWVSDAMPQLATQVDKLAILRGMHTPNLTHEPALWMIHSGQTLPGLPSLGAWVSYGLGSENDSLPTYVVLDDPAGLPINGLQNWQSGYLPPEHQGTRFRSQGPAVLNLLPEDDAPPAARTAERDLRSALDRRHAAARLDDPVLAARIAAYEMAARMQTAAMEATDLAGETQETLDLYGVGAAATDSYARRCLIARRLVERGVRFVQLFINGQIWDTHNNLGDSLRSACDQTDRPVAGLLEDLARRGLLDDTLVVWGGEMGRLPIAQLPADKDATKAGRDHNKNAMCSWLAGGGVRGGVVHGETDELGLAAVADRVSVPDFHATLLHLLGLHHERLSFPRNGLQERLTGVQHARVVTEILA